MSYQQNITRIKVVNDALDELAEQVVFVGGATVALYATRPAVEVRPTEDVDIVIELFHYKGYAEIEEKLRAKGFTNDHESGVICRYIIQGIVVDVMPTDNTVLGFANRWYPEAYQAAIVHEIDADYRIKIFPPAYFIASKLEAFLDRGGGDGRLSTDFEDIVFVLNNRPEIWDEMNQAPISLKSYLQETFATLLAGEYVYEWVSAHLDYQEQRRVNLIIGGMQAFTNKS